MGDDVRYKNGAKVFYTGDENAFLVVGIIGGVAVFTGIKLLIDYHHRQKRTKIIADKNQLGLAYNF